MSFYSGFDFFSWLIVILIPAAVLGFWKSKYLRLYRGLASGVFIYLIYSSTPDQLWLLLGYAVFALFLSKGYLVIKNKGWDSDFTFHTAIALALCLLVLYKISALGEGIGGFLGISYICFRSIQVIIEIHDGIIKEIPAYQYLNFLLFFPSLSSGPIDRSRRFAEDDLREYSRDEYGTLFEAGVFKIVLGAFYKIVCADIAHAWMQDFFSRPYGVLTTIGSAYTYGLYLFFDFAGYSSMAVGTAYVLGIKLPDNFKYPFISIDMKDFWNRWHISLSTWFRDFIFNRFMMKVLKKKWFASRINAASVGYIVNMFIMGMWHGLTPYYITYGLYHGVILALTEIYQRKSKFYKKQKDKLWYKAVSWFITLNIVMFGFLIFSGYIHTMAKDIIIGAVR